MRKCLTLERLRYYACGLTDQRKRVYIETHVAQCEQCRSLLTRIQGEMEPLSQITGTREQPNPSPTFNLAYRRGLALWRKRCHLMAVRRIGMAVAIILLVGIGPYASSPTRVAAENIPMVGMALSSVYRSIDMVRGFDQTKWVQNTTVLGLTHKIAKSATDGDVKLTVDRVFADGTQTIVSFTLINDRFSKLMTSNIYPRMLFVDQDGQKYDEHWFGYSEERPNPKMLAFDINFPKLRPTSKELTLLISKILYSGKKSKDYQHLSVAFPLPDQIPQLALKSYPINQEQSHDRFTVRIDSVSRTEAGSTILLSVTGPTPWQASVWVDDAENNAIPQSTYPGLWSNPEDERNHIESTCKLEVRLKGNQMPRKVSVSFSTGYGGDFGWTHKHSDPVITVQKRIDGGWEATPFEGYNVDVVEVASQKGGSRLQLRLATRDVIIREMGIRDAQGRVVVSKACDDLINEAKIIKWFTRSGGLASFDAPIKTTDLGDKFEILVKRVDRKLNAPSRFECELPPTSSPN